MTEEYLQNVLSETQNDPSFDEIVNQIVDNYLYGPEPNQDAGAHTSSTSSSEKPSPVSKASTALDIPIKQRLRPRSERKIPLSERKKKINIISNEPYTGIVPAAANLQPIISTLEEPDPPDPTQIVLFVQNGIEMIPVLQGITTATTSSSSIINSVQLDSLVTTTSTVIYPSMSQNQVPNFELETEATGKVEDGAQIEKEMTPKHVQGTSFLESKCNSSPRRKATHVRILDFAHTPSHRRLPTLLEHSTPTGSGIPQKTPGSAPATIKAWISNAKVQDEDQKENEPQQPKLAVIDENSNSNSNSISNTPKVVKNPRRRKIAVTKKEKATKAKSAEPELEDFTLNDWMMMRKQSQTLQIDQQLRLANQEVEKVNYKLRKSPKKRSIKKKATPAKKCKKKAFASPDEQKEIGDVKVESSTSTEFDENKPLSTMKFKITSPRKVASLKKAPKRKRSPPDQKLEALDESKKQEQETVVETVTEENMATEISSELNRSDTVQEVATILTTISETILANDSVVKAADVSETDGKAQMDSGIENLLLETPFKGPFLSFDTPFKDHTLTPLPNTPRFAIPLGSTSQETPAPKIFSSNSNTVLSIVKVCDILTPTFAITPGFKVTPLKDDVSPTSGGYSSRKTDYSSCSSYYKPDESEDININALVSQKIERHSQSESDGGCVHMKPLKTRKIDCPGAIERVKSFTDEQKDLPTPHCTMMEEGILSESMVTTCTDDSSSSSSSFTCSTCSTDPSDDEYLVEILNKEPIKTDEDTDGDFQLPKLENESPKSKILMNEKTGEVRFPLRNWITPKKIEINEQQARIEDTNKIKSLLNTNDPRRGISIEEERKKKQAEMEIVKKRTLEKLRGDSMMTQSKTQPKYKKSNIKNFKLPAEDLKPLQPPSRKEQILQNNHMKERTKPTPLRLISSRRTPRKNAAPRKTIVIDDLPREPSPIKKKKYLKSEVAGKSPVKVVRLSLESVSDNAIMPEDSASLNISSSFNSNFEDESADTVVKISPAKAVVIDEGSNTFQRTLIAQGFNKDEAKDLQTKLVDKIEEKEEKTEEKEAAEKVPVMVPVEDSKENEDEISSDDDDNEECDFFLADANEKHVFLHQESENIQPGVPSIAQIKINPVIACVDDLTITLKDSGMMDLFSMPPGDDKKSSPKKSSNDKKISQKSANGKELEEELPNKNGKSKSSRKSNEMRWDQSKLHQKEMPEK